MAVGVEYHHLAAARDKSRDASEPPLGDERAERVAVGLEAGGREPTDSGDASVMAAPTVGPWIPIASAVSAAQSRAEYRAYGLMQVLLRRGFYTW